MTRNHLVLGAVALMSMLAGALLFNQLQTEPTVKSVASIESRVELQSIPLSDLNGKQSLIGDWKGDILIVNFWAPWCAPCRREVPTLIKYHREYAQRGVRVIGIAYDNEPQVRRFATEYQINYPLFLAGNKTAMYNAAFANHSGSLPFTAILDRDLNIVFQHNGELSAEQLQQQLDALL